MVCKFVIGLAAVATVFGVSASNAAVFTGIDFTALNGTSYSSINASPVQVDFGPGRGTGTLSVSSNNGGSFRVLETPPSFRYPGSYTLGSGDTYVTTDEVIFAPVNPASDTAPRGFNLTFSLTGGRVFSAGSLFIARSLDNRTDIARATFFQPGLSFGVPDTASLPSDGNTPLVVVGSDGNGPIYGTRDGTTEGRAFGLLSDAANFTVSFTSIGRDQGVAFQFAQVAVPEPASIGLLITAIVGAAGLTRRRAVNG